MKIYSKKVLKSITMKDLRLKTGWYNADLKSYKLVEFDDKTRWLLLELLLEVGKKIYPMKKFFPIEWGSNGKLLELLEEIHAIQEDGNTIDWDCLRDYWYRVQVYFHKESSSYKIGDIIAKEYEPEDTDECEVE